MIVHSVFESTGGAEIQAKRLASNLQRRGWVVKVVGLRPKRSGVTAGDHELPVETLSTVSFPGIAGPALMFKLARYLFRHRSEYDAIHVHIMKTMALVAGVAGKVLHKPVVLKVSGYDELDNGSLNPQLSNKMRNRLINWGCKKASAVVAISRLTERRLQQCGYREQQIVYLPNGVDIDRFRPINDKFKLRKEIGVDSELMGVFVGRFVHEKGLFDLLDAWRSVREANSDAVLVLVGDGRLRPAVQALVEADPVLRVSVKLAGESRQVEKYLNAADCYVSASLTEGLSNTMLEAMACGLPLVSTAVSGAEDIIENQQNGFVVPIGDSKALAKAVSAIFGNSDMAREMGRRSRQMAMERFDIDKVIDRYERLYSGN